MSQTFEKGLLKSSYLVDTETPNIELLTQAIQSGITSVVLDPTKFTSTNGTTKVELGLQLKQLSQQYSLPLIVVDDASLAVQIKADGILVQDDTDALSEIVAGVNNNMFIGFYIKDLGQIKYAQQIEQVDYFVVDNQNSSLIGQVTKPVAVIGQLSEQHLAVIKNSGANGIIDAVLFEQTNNLKQTIQTINDLFK